MICTLSPAGSPLVYSVAVVHKNTDTLCIYLNVCSVLFLTKWVLQYINKLRALGFKNKKNICYWGNEEVQSNWPFYFPGHSIFQHHTVIMPVITYLMRYY